MITESAIYWITRLDAFKEIFIIVGWVGLLVSLIVGVFVIVLHVGGDFREESVRIRKPFLILSIITSICISIQAFIPTTKEYAAMVFIPKIASNEELKGEAKELYELSKEYLKDQLTIPSNRKVAEENKKCNM